LPYHYSDVFSAYDATHFYFFFIYFLFWLRPMGYTIIIVIVFFNVLVPSVV